MLIIKNKIILIVLMLLFTHTALNCQLFKQYRISGGVTTNEILGDNPGNKPIFERDTLKDPIIGGSFDHSQVGFSLNCNMYFGKDLQFSIPVGFDYVFYQGLEQVPIYSSVTLRMKHTFNVPVFTLGFNYYFVKFPKTNVRGFAEIETRTAFISENSFWRELEFKANDSTYVVEGATKSACVRFGGSLKLGFEGEIIDPWYINAHAGIGILNLLGKNDDRGELFTPMKKTSSYIETKESTVYIFSLNLMIQYRL